MSEENFGQGHGADGQRWKFQKSKNWLVLNGLIITINHNKQAKNWQTMPNIKEMSEQKSSLTTLKTSTFQKFPSFWTATDISNVHILICLKMQ